MSEEVSTTITRFQAKAMIVAAEGRITELLEMAHKFELSDPQKEKCIKERNALQDVIRCFHAALKE
jgi:hypothetical protein